MTLEEAQRANLPALPVAWVCEDCGHTQPDGRVRDDELCADGEAHWCAPAFLPLTPGRRFRVTSDRADLWHRKGAVVTVTSSRVDDAGLHVTGTAAVWTGHTMPFAWSPEEWAELAAVLGHPTTLPVVARAARRIR